MPLPHANSCADSNVAITQASPFKGALPLCRSSLAQTPPELKHGSLARTRALHHAGRPDYKELRLFKEAFPSVPLIALTATATPRVQHDVRFQLRIPNCVVFKSSFNRPNLRWGGAGGQGQRVGGTRRCLQHGVLIVPESMGARA